MKSSPVSTVNYLQFVDYIHKELQLQDRPPKQQEETYEELLNELKQISKNDR